MRRGVADNTRSVNPPPPSIPTSATNTTKKQAVTTTPTTNNNNTKNKNNHNKKLLSPPVPGSEEEEETDISSSSSEGEDISWISWFCGLRGNELLCEVDEDYIQDDFNLCGLQGQVPRYDHALDIILDNDPLSPLPADMDGEQNNETESAAELLYGLIHARYILTHKGLNAMHEKYKRVEFGRCARVSCSGQPCLPVGTSDIPRGGSVKIYCPKCEDIYFPRCKYQSNMDGAYIGTTFPHLFLMTYPSAKPAKPVQTYVPRIFGFKVHKGVK
ncbi:casein kinase II subunit beta-3-like [Papaver somniferum]|uniref:casein kinase II subunit beta-3-like n=1 Tax=Papaver somniferum TaxID=3469 RepID=UPI000E705EE6|nr:casein kinase II subunit beta-3-like [Papaver somniferum]XP_026377098.1 casein kinase II subunit beta-3-like [Papaver somniferum]